MKKSLIFGILLGILGLVCLNRVYAAGVNVDPTRSDTLRVDTTIISKTALQNKTYIQALPAAGADKYYSIEKVSVYADTGRAYTGGKGGIVIGYKNTLVSPIYIAPEVITTTPPFLSVIYNNGSLGGDYKTNQYSNIVNQALYIRAGSGNSQYIGGTANYRVIVYYRVHTIK